MAKGLKVERVLFTMSREPGLGIFLDDQQASNVKSVVKGNTALHIVLRQTLPEDIDQAAKMLGLSKELKAMIPSLPTGTAIAKDEEHPEAFVVKLRDSYPNLPYPKEETVVAGGREELAELEAFVVPRSRRAVAEPGRSDSVTKDEGPAPLIEEACSPTDMNDPMAVWKTMLSFLVDNPDKGIVELYQAMGMGRNKGDRLKCDLLEMGLVEQTKGEPSGRGKPKTHLRLTKRGLEYLGLGASQAAEPLKGKGSEEHRRLQKAIADKLRAEGMLAVIEADIQGRKKVDVLIHDIPNNRTFGVEVHLNRKWSLLEEQLLKGACGARDVVVHLAVSLRLYLRGCLKDRLSSVRFIPTDFIPARKTIG